ncbi:MAG: hypothetical protein ACQETB_02060 [Halobacteriota archaeon]
MDEADVTDSIDLEHPDRVRIGATRGEFNTEIGRPRDYPDSADISIQYTDDDRVSIMLDATAGDHGTGHADFELSLEETAEVTAALQAILEAASE